MEILKTNGNRILSRKIFQPVFLLLILILSAVIGNLLMLNNYHNRGGDFSLYLSQGRALANGGYMDLLRINTDMMDHGKMGPYLYPIGYPLLIAPLFKLFAFKLIYFKIYTFLIFLTGLYFFYKIAGLMGFRIESTLLVILSLLLSPVFLGHHNQILSDTPSFTFCLIVIFYYIKLMNNPDLYKQKLNTDVILVSVFTGIAVFTRTTNIILIPAMVLASFIKMFYQDKKYNYFLLHSFIIASFTFILFLVNIYWPLNRGGNEVNSLLHSDIGKSLIHNSMYYADLIASPLAAILSEIMGKTLALLHVANSQLLAAKTAFALTWGIYLFFIFTYLKSRRLNSIVKFFICIFTLGVLAVYLIWPYTEGQRFIFIIYPFLFSFLYNRVYSFQNGKSIYHLLFAIPFFIIVKGIIILFIFLNIDLSKAFEKDCMSGSANLNKMSAYIKDSVSLSNGKVIGYYNPRVLYFYTNKISYQLDAKTLDKMEYILVQRNFDEAFLHQNNLSGEVTLIKKCGDLELYQTGTRQMIQ